MERSFGRPATRRSCIAFLEDIRNVPRNPFTSGAAGFGTASVHIERGGRNGSGDRAGRHQTRPGLESEFEAGVGRAVPLFQRAKGCNGMELQRSHKKQSRYRLFVRWETLENHTVDFRES